MTALALLAIVGLVIGCSPGPAGRPTATDQPTYSQAPEALEPGSTSPTIHVATDGDDEADGSEDTPFATIARAAEVAEPGDTVIVADGTYDGAFTTYAAGTEDAPIVYVAENKWGAVLTADGDDVDDDVFAVWRNYGDHTEIRGFEITGTVNDGLIQTGSHSRLMENRVHGFTDGTCVSTYKLEYALSDIDIIGNVVFGCGSSSLDHGIYPGHPGGTISNNISYGNAGYGIHCWHNCNALTISNNLVFDNAEGGILIGQGDGPHYGEVDADDFVVANNIVVDNGNDGIKESGATGSNNRYLNNNVANNGSDELDVRGNLEYGTISDYPDFLDFRIDGTGDYRLRPSSPGVDSGNEEGAPPTDIEGTPRPQGREFDVGVYEQ